MRRLLLEKTKDKPSIRKKRQILILMRVIFMIQKKILILLMYFLTIVQIIIKIARILVTVEELFIIMKARDKLKRILVLHNCKGKGNRGIQLQW